MVGEAVVSASFLEGAWSPDQESRSLDGLGHPCDSANTRDCNYPALFFLPLHRSDMGWHGCTCDLQRGLLANLDWIAPSPRRFPELAASLIGQGSTTIGTLSFCARSGESSVR
jgi:hypothetical protein